VSWGAQAERVRGWWVLGTLCPFGLGSGVAFAYAARRAGMPAWRRAGGLWFGASLVGYVVAVATKHHDTPAHAIALAVMLAAWGGAFVHALLVRGEYVRRAGPRAATAAARAAAAEARRIAREEPRLAVELGIGRPDREGAYDGGLVDVNHAPPRALERLPGIGPVRAERIAEAREQCDGFGSVEELGEMLDLDGATVERLRERAVFLPR